MLASLENIGKLYGDRLVLKNVNLQLGRRSLYLLTGRNGSGKSTLLKIIAGLARPDSGSIKKMDSLNTAYLGHDTFIYPALTAFQNLRFWARAYRIKADDAALMEVLRRVRLEKRAHDQARTFSRGMAQRLNFGRALMQGADLYLLDEPFTGMDTASRELLSAELARLRENGAGILMVTHSPEAHTPDQILELAQHTLSCQPVGRPA